MLLRQRCFLFRLFSVHLSVHIYVIVRNLFIGISLSTILLAAYLTSMFCMVLLLEGSVQCLVNAYFAHSLQAFLKFVLYTSVLNVDILRDCMHTASTTCALAK